MITHALCISMAQMGAVKPWMKPQRPNFESRGERDMIGERAYRFRFQVVAYTVSSLQDKLSPSWNEDVAGQVVDHEADVPSIALELEVAACSVVDLGEVVMTLLLKALWIGFVDLLRGSKVRSRCLKRRSKTD